MCIRKPLCLRHRFELAHTSISHSYWLVRQLTSSVRAMRCVVNRFRDKFSMRNAVAPQLIGDNFLRLAFVFIQ